MEKVSKETFKYNLELFLSGVARITFILVSVALIVAAVIGVLRFIAFVL